MTTRACSNGRLVEPGSKANSLKTFMCDSTKLWNKAPNAIKQCNFLSTAKMKSRNMWQSCISNNEIQNHSHYLYNHAMKQLYIP